MPRAVLEFFAGTTANTGDGRVRLTRIRLHIRPATLPAFTGPTFPNYPVTHLGSLGAPTDPATTATYIPARPQCHPGAADDAAFDTDRGRTGFGGAEFQMCIPDPAWRKGKIGPKWPILRQEWATRVAPSRIPCPAAVPRPPGSTRPGFRHTVAGRFHEGQRPFPPAGCLRALSRVYYPSFARQFPGPGSGSLHR